jgi:hypothetical protein
MLFGIDRITHSNLKVELEDLKKQIETLRSLNEQFKKRIDGEFSTASFAIDWDAMQVFSIERNMSCGYAHTILGYMLSEPVIHTEEKITYKDVVREWHLYCSAEKHEELVKEFNVWKGKKK